MNHFFIQFDDFIQILHFLPKIKRSQNHIILQKIYLKSPLIQEKTLAKYYFSR